MTKKKLSLRDRLAIPLINFLIKILCSKQYRNRLDMFMRLGHLKAAELLARKRAMDAKLASEPGMTPDGQIVTPE